MTEAVINKIVFQMQEDLSAEQQSKLRNVILVCIQEEEKQELTTEVVEEVNYRALQAYAASLLVANRSKRTVKQYVYNMKRFFTEVNKDFRLVTKMDLIQYLAKLTLSGKLNASSVDNTRRYLRSFFAWCKSVEYIEKDPSENLQAITRSAVKKEILTDIELEQLRASCQTLRQVALVDFLNATGLRVSEVVQLNKNDVQLDTREVSIYGEKTRTYRTVFLDARALISLKTYWEARQDSCEAAFVSHTTATRISREAINAELHRISRKTTRKNVTVHTFRKTLATRLHNRGMSLEHIASILGHSTGTCIRYYVEANQPQIKTEYQKYIS